MIQLSFNLKLEAQVSATFTTKSHGKMFGRGAHRMILAFKRLNRQFIVVFQDRIELSQE